MQQRQRAGVVYPKQGAVSVRPAECGRAVDVTVVSLDQPRIRIRAVGCRERMQRRERPGGIDPIDGAVAARATVRRGAVEEAVARLGDAGVRRRTVDASEVVEAANCEPRVDRSRHVDRAARDGDRVVRQVDRSERDRQSLLQPDRQDRAGRRHVGERARHIGGRAQLRRIERRAVRNRRGKCPDDVGRPLCDREIARAAAREV